MNGLAVMGFVPPNPPSPPQVKILDEIQDVHLVVRTVRRTVFFGASSSTWIAKQTIVLPSDPPKVTTTYVMSEA